MGKFDPLSYWSNALELGYLMAEAQAVISMRLMGMAGIWSVTPAEDDRMVSEKTQAMHRAGADATRVMLAGGTPDRVMAAAIKPIRQKTRANAKRLGKRGLKKELSGYPFKSRARNTRRFTGDRVRLADTDLIIEVERDLTTYGEEVKFGGGKVIRDGMGQSQVPRGCGAVDTVITNAPIVDHTGI